MSEVKEFNTSLANVNNAYLPMIKRQMENNAIEFTEYQKKCVLNAIGAINQVLDAANLNWNNQQLDQSNITTILFNIASLELNAVAEPREVYFQIRNVPVKDAKGSITSWKKKIEMGIEGDGNDAILARFGRDVKKVYPYWLVREDDVFEYPKFNGLAMEPPKWEPRGTGKVVRVVYPILYTDNTVHFHISERQEVKNNLLAHINNNMMNETFGIVKDRKDATPQQLESIKAKKAEIKSRAGEMELADILKDKELAKFISPSWKEDFAGESMIIRKMRNNVTKKIPKDFGHSAIQEAFMEATEDSYKTAKEDIIEQTASVLIEDISPSDNAEGAKSEPNTSKGSETRVDADIAPDGEISPQERTKPDFN